MGLPQVNIGQDRVVCAHVGDRRLVEIALDLGVGAGGWWVEQEQRGLQRIWRQDAIEDVEVKSGRCAAIRRAEADFKIRQERHRPFREEITGGDEQDPRPFSRSGAGPGEIVERQIIALHAG